MNGAESLMHAARNARIDVCFANPQPESATASGARSAAKAERSPPGAMPSLAGGTGSGATEDAALGARPPRGRDEG